MEILNRFIGLINNGYIISQMTILSRRRLGFKMSNMYAHFAQLLALLNRPREKMIF